MRLNTCPCCGGSLLRHARQGGVYWFCTSCRQDMPILLAGKLPSNIGFRDQGSGVREKHA